MTLPSPTSDAARVRAWLEIREPLERQLAPLGRAAMAALRPAAGERALDVGCGVGATPFALAEAVGPDGRVLAVDRLSAALDALRDAPDLPGNLAFLCADAGTHPFEPGGFDLVYSRFGVMFFEDPVAAFANLRRALRPGGRLGFVCWRGLEENELDALPLRAAAAHLPAEAVEAAASAGWFSFSDRAAIADVLAAAGFEGVAVTAHDQAVGSGDLDSMVAVCSRVGALGAILRQRPELRGRAAPALEAALRPLDFPGGPRLRAATWIAQARAPA